jgi:hypothetical protein
VQARGFAVVGVGELGARIGTALAAAAMPLVLYGFARQPLGARAALLAAVALATSLEFVALGRIAFTDMLLMLWFTVCIGALHRAFEAGPRGTGWFALACLASALAILTKGAIGVLFPGAVALVHLLLLGRLREMLRPGWIALAFPLVFGVGFSWYLLLGLTQPGGFDFMRDLFLEHHVGRFTAPMQGHAGSPLFYVPVLLVGMLPWSPFLPLAVARAGLRLNDERARFLRLFALSPPCCVLLVAATTPELHRARCRARAARRCSRARARDRASPSLAAPRPRSAGLRAASPSPGAPPGCSGERAGAAGDRSLGGRRCWRRSRSSARRRRSRRSARCGSRAFRRARADFLCACDLFRPCAPRRALRRAAAALAAHARRSWRRRAIVLLGLRHRRASASARPTVLPRGGCRGGGAFGGGSAHRDHGDPMLARFQARRWRSERDWAICSARAPPSGGSCGEEASSPAPSARRVQVGTSFGSARGAGRATPFQRITGFR